jgi:hypothetical protein
MIGAVVTAMRALWWCPGLRAAQPATTENGK